MRIIAILSISFLISCNTANNQELKVNEIQEEDDSSICTRFNVPENYKRVAIDTISFQYYLRNLELKPSGSNVKLYNGKNKGRQDVHAAVIDMSVGDKDLQQCADAIMRLRAEYLFQRKLYNKIHFNFTSGHTVNYKDWAEGKRPIIEGNKVTFSQKASKDYSYKSFMKYMQTIFTYCGSYSLDKELVSVKDIKDIQIGDIFIQGGFPGHAVIVLDVAKNTETGEPIFLLGQSYMPAQEIHVLKNFNDKKLSPWYSINFGETLHTPEWSFQKNMLKRFPEE